MVYSHAAIAVSDIAQVGEIESNLKPLLGLEPPHVRIYHDGEYPGFAFISNHANLVAQRVLPSPCTKMAVPWPKGAKRTSQTDRDSFVVQ
jgi:hypothetical protein